MPFNKNRNSRDDKSGKDQNKSPRSGTSGRPKSGKSFSSDSSSKPGSGFRKKAEDGNSKSYRGSGPERKPYGDKKEGGYGAERKSFGDRRESSGDRRESSGDRKPYGDRKEGAGSDRKPFSESYKSFREDRRPARTRKDPASENDEYNLDADGKGKSENHSRPYKKREPENFAPRAAREEGIADENLKLRSRKPNTNFKKDSDTIRLNRYIANSGICSRRKADELIAAGVVSVNGEVVSELGAKVNPSVDQIRYNGELLKREKMVYVLLNKPKDFITTTDDPQERKTVMELVDKASKERIYPVGRLDRNTTGLLLMTNDGDLAEKLSHPRNNISKIYNVELSRNLSQGDFNKIAFGLELEDGFIKPDSVSYVTGGAKNEIGIQIHSGKNRIVRRIFESLGYEVVKLDRVIYANLSKKDLPRGKWRYLSENEIIQLKHFIK